MERIGIAIRRALFSSEACVSHGRLKGHAPESAEIRWGFVLDANLKDMSHTR